MLIFVAEDYAEGSTREAVSLQTQGTNCKIAKRTITKAMAHFTFYTDQRLSDARMVVSLFT